MKNQGLNSKDVLKQQMDAVEVFHTIYRSAVKDDDVAKKGSHTEVHFLDPSLMTGNMLELAKRKGEISQQQEERIRLFARRFAERFVVKVGRTSDYTVRLGGKEPAVLPRAYISEVWGPMGFSIYPTWNKIVSDCTEAVRLIPYFFHGQASDIVLPHLIPVFQKALAGELEDLPQGGDEGLFLVKALEEYDFYSIFSLLDKDPYTAYRPKSMEELREISGHLRAMPLDAKLTEEIRRYFESPVEYGVQGFLRRLAGLDKPVMRWELARTVIEEAFSRHRHELFLPPEINYYIPAPWMAPDEVGELLQHNRKVLDAAIDILKKRISKVHMKALGERRLTSLLADLFTHLHDYPEYELEENISLVSPATLKITVKSLSFLMLFLSDIILPDRLNADVEDFLAKSGWRDELVRLMPSTYKSFLVSLYDFILEYMILGAVPDDSGNKLKWKPIVYTFVTIQEKADYVPEGWEKLDVFSMESLFKPQYRVYLYKYPQLAEKLIVFFVMAIRYFMETDFVPDLRPDEVFVNMILLGIWGWMTENMLITVYRSPDGEEGVKIRFIDNKDQFKRYRREVDRKYPLGIGKYALHLVAPIAGPALLRAIATFTLITYENSRGTKPETEALSPLENSLVAAREFLLGQLEHTTENAKYFISTFIDDVTHFLLHKLSGKKEKDRQ